MTKIHPTAVVDPRAEIHPDVEIGSNCVIDGPVTIGTSDQPANVVPCKRGRMRISIIHPNLSRVGTYQDVAVLQPL